MEAGTAAFELNYPFVYPSMKADQPKLFKSFKWTLYPQVNANEPSHVTIGGIDLAISKYSPHPDLAFQAALCLRDPANQLIAATKGGLPPTIASLYNNPALYRGLPVPRGHPAGAADRERPAEDARLPEPVHRHLPPRVAPGRDQSRRAPRSRWPASSTTPSSRRA